MSINIDVYQYLYLKKRVFCGRGAVEMKKNEENLKKKCIWCIAAMISILPLLVIIVILLMDRSQ